MIVELEIQQFIKEIESKLSTMKDTSNAENKIIVLEMAISEIREGYRLLKDSMRLTQAEQINNLKLIQENNELKLKLNDKEKEIEEIKANIT